MHPERGRHNIRCPTAGSRAEAHLYTLTETAGLWMSSPIAQLLDHPANRQTADNLLLSA